MKLNLILAPNKILDTPSKAISKVDNRHVLLSYWMHFYLVHWKGIGLAAPQVGKNIRMIVINTLGLDNGIKLTLINPEIIEKSEELFEWDEGCLSVPGVYIKRQRPKKIKIRYLNIQGKEQVSEFTDLNAFCIQHERDHLDGILFCPIDI